MNLKILAIFSLLSWSSEILTAQVCQTPDISQQEYEAIPWYGDENEYTALDRMYDSLINIYGNVSNPIARLESGMLLKIPIKFWIYRESETVPGGTGTIPTEENLQFAIDDINEAYSNSNIDFRFYIYDIEPVDNAERVVMDSYIERQLVAQTHRNLTCLNVHVVDDGGDTAEPGYDAFFIQRERFATAEAAKTFAHESGHYFGLLHTFFGHGIPCIKEPVSRSVRVTPCPPLFISKRCAFTGDLLCDTDADPKMDDFGTYTAGNTCSWNGNGMTDWNGDLYHPNEDNYMAYGNNDCRTEFTTGQKMWMTVWAFRFKDAVQKGWLPGWNDGFDTYEPDNADIAARLIHPGETQVHTFHAKGRAEVDWVYFEIPPCGLTQDIVFTVTDLTNNAVDEVAFFERGTNNTAGSELVASETNGVFTLPLGTVMTGHQYLIRITPATENSEYSIYMPFLGSCVLGDDVICNGLQKTYSIDRRPAGSSINWTKSSNIFYVAGQGTNSFTVRGSFMSGPGWVQPIISMAGVSDTLPKKNIWVGTPGNLSFDYYPSTFGCTAGEVGVGYLESADSYTFNVSGGIITQSNSASFTGSQSFINVDPNDLGTSMTITATASNTCGTTFPASVTVPVSCNSGPGGPCCITPQIVINPNPSPGDIDISITNIEELEELQTETEIVYQVEVTDLLGNSKKKGALNKNGLSINLKHLDPGVYLVNISRKDFYETYRIVIE